MIHDLASLKAGITIENILDDFGITHRHHRAACPVHKGDNRSAFSYNDETFYCHTRGCKGDVVTLIMALARTDFKGALGYLGRKRGVAVDFGVTRTTEFSKCSPGQSDLPTEERKRMSTTDCVDLLCMADDLSQAEIDLAGCKQNIAKLTQKLTNLNRLKKRKKIARSMYYLNVQRIEDNRLVIYDEQEAALNYKIKRLKKAISDLRKNVVSR